jgi:hypothetical protein
MGGIFGKIVKTDSFLICLFSVAVCKIETERTKKGTADRRTFTTAAFRSLPNGDIQERSQEKDIS